MSVELTQILEEMRVAVQAAVGRRSRGHQELDEEERPTPILFNPPWKTAEESDPKHIASALSSSRRCETENVPKSVFRPVWKSVAKIAFLVLLLAFLR